jgi:hypothetical protein
MTTPADMVAICALGPYTVLAALKVITWIDGSRIVVHRVLTHGADAPLLRAVHHAELGWLIFNLCEMGPVGLRRDLLELSLDDYDGAALYALRVQCKDARTAWSRIVRRRQKVAA